MSYVRWSSPRRDLDGACPECSIDWAVKSDKPEPLEHVMELWKRQRAYRDRTGHLCQVCTSNWYIYDHVYGGLAIWATGFEELPIYPIDEVKEMLATNDFSRIPGFSKYGDQGVLKSSMLLYVQDCTSDLAP